MYCKKISKEKRREEKRQMNVTYLSLSLFLSLSVCTDLMVVVF
jgi:hypothetical protein